MTPALGYVAGQYVGGEGHLGAVAETVLVSGKATIVVKAVSSPTGRLVRNAGTHAVTLARGSNVAVGSGFALASGELQMVWFEPGEALWGVCAEGQSSALEVL